MKKILTVGLSLLLVVGLVAGCSGSKVSGTVKMAGSTSMEELAKAFGEAFTEENPDTTVDVQAGGSGAGYTQVTRGSVDLGNMSRDLKDSEKSDTLTATVVAIDGIAIVVNPSNTVKSLTSAQIVSIYTGAITNWNQVGGADAEIVVVGREAGSGTRDGFESILKLADKCKYDAEMTETGSVKSTVASTTGAIGYISLGYVDSTVTALTVDGVVPSTKTVQDGTYTIQRNFNMVMLNSNTNEAAKAFLEFILSDDGQKIVEQMHFVPVK